MYRNYLNLIILNTYYESFYQLLNVYFIMIYIYLKSYEALGCLISLRDTTHMLLINYGISQLCFQALNNKQKKI